jgi:hypothetical protein
MVQRTLLVVLISSALATATVAAQRGGGGGRGAAAPSSPRDAAALDLTGYWVSVITEDWKLRMVTPKKGVFDALPLNAAARQAGEAWDPAKDEAAGEQCKAYGAANIMRLPGRLHVTWQDANTLKIETDTGTQTRLFHFDRQTPPAQPSWQGYSLAQWEYAAGSGRGAARLGDLKVVTNHLRAGYVRKNGVPYSDQAVVTEYYDVNTLPNGDQFLTITTRVEDPVYFRAPYITTTDFKKLPNATGWNPTPCSAK